MVGAGAGVRKADPTGAGDAFRAGFLAAVAWGLSLERAASWATCSRCTSWRRSAPQEYELKPGALAERFAAVYGPAAAAEVSARYS